MQYTESVRLITSRRLWQYRKIEKEEKVWLYHLELLRQQKPDKGKEWWKVFAFGVMYDKGQLLLLFSDDLTIWRERWLMKMNRHKYYNDPAFFSKVIARIYNVMVRQNFLRLFSLFLSISFVLSSLLFCLSGVAEMVNFLVDHSVWKWTQKRLVLKSGIRPWVSLPFISERLGVELSNTSLTTLLCPLIQAFINRVYPRMSLAFKWGEAFLITFTHSGNVAVVFYEKRIFFVQIRSSCRSVRIKDLCSSYFPTPYFFTLCVHSLNFVWLWTNQQVFIVTLWRQVAMGFSMQ